MCMWFKPNQLKHQKNKQSALFRNVSVLKESTWGQVRDIIFTLIVAGLSEFD